MGFKNLRGIGGVNDGFVAAAAAVVFCDGPPGVVVGFVVVTLAASVTRFTL